MMADQEDQNKVLSEEARIGISKASNDLLFQYIVEKQDGSFGHLLDAGTGSHSLRWIASLFQNRMISQYTAITADEQMRQTVLTESRTLQIEEYGQVLIGNWFATKNTATEKEDSSCNMLCNGQIYDTIIADYLIGAMDGFSPYYQDLIFSRLSQHLHPKHGRLYIVGLNPIPDKVDGDGQIICEVTKLRDACILLAGHRCYREFPLEWVQRNLLQNGYKVIASSIFPILYSRDTIVRQLNVARSKLPLFPSKQLADSMSKQIDELEERATRILRQKNEQRIKMGFDYVVVAELGNSRCSTPT